MGDGRWELKVVVDQETHERLEALTGLLSHRNPTLSCGELIAILAWDGVTKYDPRHRADRKGADRPASTSAQKSERADAGDAATSAQKRSRTTTRHVPDAVRAQVWERDAAQCSYVDPQTGRRCGSSDRLEIDHVQPWAIGGDHAPDNLRLLCGHHHRHRSARAPG